MHVGGRACLLSDGLPSYFSQVSLFQFICQVNSRVGCTEFLRKLVFCGLATEHHCSHPRDFACVPLNWTVLNY